MYKFFAAFLFIFLSTASFTQIQDSISISYFKHIIKSQYVGEDRSVIVRVPADYSRSTEKYPVLYMLDWQAPQNVMITGLVDQLVWGNLIPNTIIVGIPNTNRMRDLSPTKTDRPNTGGGDNFLDFLGKEVIPLIQKNYRTHPYSMFAGHSLGGLTVAYTFITRPHMFNAYFAASPNIQWDNSVLLSRAKNAFQKNRNWNKVFYTSLGNEPDYDSAFNAFAQQLKTRQQPGFDFTAVHLPEDNHSSTVLPTYYGGLRKVFSGWNPPNRASLVELENHYKKLSDRLGYKVDIPENRINFHGYDLLRVDNVDGAIAVFKKNVELYPNSPNVYDSLGEAYERKGDFKNARDNYEKAYQMAKAQGDERIATAAKDNLERVLKKVR